jgi:aryl-phospho-beta-D-glucosidase BglC (GH1 family)
MEKLHQYRTHIYSFVAGLAVVTLGISVYSFFYNPADAMFATPYNSNTGGQSVGYTNPDSNGAINKPNIINSSPSTWKGVNVGLQLSTSAKTSFSQIIAESAAVGANVIRLNVFADPANQGIAYAAFVDGNGAVIPAATSPGIAQLQTAINLAAQSNIKVIIDMHTFPGISNASIWTSQSQWETFDSIWTTIATTFKNNPNVVAFDLMNEPNVLDSLDAKTKATYSHQMFQGTWTPPSTWAGTPRDYNMEMTELIGKIRAIDPSRTVIVEGFGVGGNPINYAWMKPISAYTNVVYSFHMYEPTGLTFIGQQGFVAAGKNGGAFNYPADESKIDHWLSYPIAFQQKYNVPMYVGEFGIETDAIFKSDPSTHVAYNGSCWMSSLLSDMDSHNWGWTFWSFSTAGRVPISSSDPRYTLLQSDMTKGLVSNLCTNLPVLNSAVSSLPISTKTFAKTIIGPVSSILN